MYTVLVVLVLGAVGSTLAAEGTCNPGGIRKDCGYPGIGHERCVAEDRGCCWNTDIIGVPWCFFAEEEEVEVDPCADLTGWTKVGGFNLAEGDDCPENFAAYFSGEEETGKKACGMIRLNKVQCASVVYPVTVPYTQVCGRTRGYQLQYPEAFEVTRYKRPDERTIDQVYVDGVSITQGSSPRRHLWTNAAALAEKFYKAEFVCPCAKPDSYPDDLIPDFVGEDYYCEAGRRDVRSEAGEGDLWDDPLWDGEGCTVEGNKCCERFGWFHRTVEESSDPIEVRLCDDHRLLALQSNVALDQVEIYVK